MNKSLLSIGKFTFTAVATTTIILASASSDSRLSSFAAQTAVKQVTVTIEGFQFKPAEVTLKQGGSVTFINKDSTPHTATPEEEAKFTGTGRLSKDQSKTVVFNTVGVQNYFCEIHPSMKGKITVVK